MLLVENFAGKCEFEPVSNSSDNESYTLQVSYCPEFVPFHIYRSQLSRFPYPIQVLKDYKNEFARKMLCVRTDVYPLAFSFWKFIHDLSYLDYKAQGLVYFFLRDRLNSGVDFIPDNEFVGHWFNMIKHFVKRKFKNRCS